MEDVVRKEVKFALVGANTCLHFEKRCRRVGLAIASVLAVIGVQLRELVLERGEDELVGAGHGGLVVHEEGQGRRAVERVSEHDEGRRGGQIPADANGCQIDYRLTCHTSLGTLSALMHWSYAALAIAGNACWTPSNFESLERQSIAK
nr:hypothetical protein CFP56_34941 [Quercus suber]